MFRSARALPVIAASWLVVLLAAAGVRAQTTAADDGTTPKAATTASGTTAVMTTVVCAANGDARTHCTTNTSAGVALVRSVGNGACLLGQSWGYDATGIWVSDRCSGEFAVSDTSGAVATSAAQPPQPTTPAPPEPIETWSSYEPGKGLLVGRTEYGELAISAYALVRYINQLPPDQTFTDHLGNEHVIDTRNDIYSHRVMVFFKGWLANPKLRYNIILWTVNTTDQDAIFAQLGYQFGRKFSVYAGINALPGTRSLVGSHPYWLGHDRVMADEYFRPYFTNGVWATGELTSGLWYSAMVGNNLSALGITSKQLTRDLATAGTLFWMPTTHEFGPQGSYGDWETHDRLATRFGISTTRSREDRFEDVATAPADNTTMRLGDSLNVFDPGSLAPGVTAQTVNYRLLSFDAGIKYKGIFLQTEVYNRWLSDFEANGPLPTDSIHDAGFYVQGAFFPVRKKLELYAATSQIFPDKSLGFRNSSEYLGGANYYISDSRNFRFNAQFTRVNRSPVSSSFGYYVGGEDGGTLSLALSVFF